MIKSWANGTEHRRVFVLEQYGEFLRAHGVGVGDAVGICSDENGASPVMRVCVCVCPQMTRLSHSNSFPHGTHSS